MTEIEYQNPPCSEILQIAPPNPKTSADTTSFVNCTKMIANKLFTKYIESGCEYEINISGTMRDELSESIGNLDRLLENQSVDLNQMYTMFEESVQEMMALQTTSFERFKQSKSFCDAKALLKNEATASAN